MLSLSCCIIKWNKCELLSTTTDTDNTLVYILNRDLPSPCEYTVPYLTKLYIRKGAHINNQYNVD